MHTASPVLEDNRRDRVPTPKKSPEGRVPVPYFELRTALGLYVRTALWVDVDKMLYGYGGPAVGYDRDFVSARITEEVLGELLSRRFPGYVDSVNHLIVTHPQFIAGKTISIEARAYHRIYSGFWNRDEDKANDRFGPEIGKRHWKNNGAMRNLYPEIVSLLNANPAAKFAFQLSNTDITPTLL
jgi:hypothetical protein